MSPTWSGRRRRARRQRRSAAAASRGRAWDMADEHRVVITIDPTQSVKATKDVAKALGDTEKAGVDAGKAIAKALGDGTSKAAAEVGKGADRSAQAAARGLGKIGRAAREVEADVASLAAELAGITAFGGLNAKGF